MTLAQANENLAAMRAETPKAARVRLIQLALSLGKLSPPAADAYRAQLAKDVGK